jgi:hypothetical protein
MSNILDDLAGAIGLGPGIPRKPKVAPQEIQKLRSGILGAVTHSHISSALTPRVHQYTSSGNYHLTSAMHLTIETIILQEAHQLRDITIDYADYDICSMTNWFMIRSGDAKYGIKVAESEIDAGLNVVRASVQRQLKDIVGDSYLTYAERDKKPEPKPIVEREEEDCWISDGTSL